MCVTSQFWNKIAQKRLAVFEYTWKSSELYLSKFTQYGTLNKFFFHKFFPHLENSYLWKRLWADTSYWSFQMVLDRIILFCYICCRGGSRTAATSKVELFVIIVNGWKLLTLITKSSTLDAAAVLDPALNEFHCKNTFLTKSVTKSNFS